jgi:hypothetical protein
MAMTDGAVQQTDGAQTGAEGASQAEGVQQQQATEAQPDPRVMERLDQLGGQIGQMFEQFGPVVEHFSQQGHQQADPFADFGGEEFATQLGEQMGMDPAQLQSTFREMAQSEAQRLVQQHIAPIAERQRIEGFEKLEGQYADMRDPQKAEQIWNSAETRAAEMVHNAGLPAEVAPVLMTPQFVELVYKAEMADQHAAAQSAAGEQQGQEVQLEQSGAAAPAPGEPSRAEQIVGAGGGANFWLGNG